MSDVAFADDVDIDELVEGTDGRSFADLAGVLREAALIALRRDPKAIAVTDDDLEQAIDSLPPTSV